jgi:YD repeat-containing protein
VRCSSDTSRARRSRSAGSSLTGLAQTSTYECRSGTSFLLAQVDALSRRTEYTCDANGNLATVARLADTGNALTETLLLFPIALRIQFGPPIRSCSRAQNPTMPPRERAPPWRNRTMPFAST